MSGPLDVSERIGTPWKLEIRRTWDGIAVGRNEVVSVTMTRDRDVLAVGVDAPFHDDPPPTSADLWHHEVAEVMLAGADERYLEVELSPHGQQLVLFLQGERNILRRGDRLDYTVDIDGGRWRGVARIPVDWLPVRTDRLNTFAMHGTLSERRHLAWKPTGGRHPDFHRLSAFGSFDECSVAASVAANPG